MSVQGWAKVRFPGSVNMRWKSCVLLPAAGRRTQFFHLIFTKPGKHTLAHPCTKIYVHPLPLSSTCFYAGSNTRSGIKAPFRPLIHHSATENSERWSPSSFSSSPLHSLAGMCYLRFILRAQHFCNKGIKSALYPPFQCGRSRHLQHMQWQNCATRRVRTPLWWRRLQRLEDGSPHWLQGAAPILFGRSQEGRRRVCIGQAGLQVHR